MNGERREKKKTILRTIRIDKDLDDALDRDANEHGISENALISSILAKYVEWDRYAEKFGRISLPHEALKAIIEATEPDKLRTAAEEFAASVPKDYIMFAYKKLENPEAPRLTSGVLTISEYTDYVYVRRAKTKID